MTLSVSPTEPKLSGNLGKTHGTKEIITDVPTLYEKALFGEFQRGNIEDGTRIVDLTDCVIIGVTGPKGSGKTLTVAYIACLALARGLPVWTNFQVKFKYRKNNGEIIELASKLVDLKELFMLPDYIQGGLVALDEYQAIAPAYGWMTGQNKLLMMFWDQLRKNSLSFVYSSKKLKRVDGFTRDETDLEIWCADASKALGGEHLREGERIRWAIKDLSGNWTGHMFEDYPVLHQRSLWGRGLWGAFDTRNRIDIWQTIAGVKLDLEKTVISNKTEQQEPWKGTVAVYVNENSGQEVPAEDLWADLKIEPSMRKKVGIELKQLGATKRQTSQGYIYAMP